MPKVSDDFILPEFVPPSLYKLYGENSLQFLDPRLITGAQGIRDFFDTEMRINTWFFGGSKINSGWRQPYTKTGALRSQHKMGRAIDFTLEGYTSDEIRKTIEDHWSYFSVFGFTTIEEDTPTWVHIDMRTLSTSSKELKKIPYGKKVNHGEPGKNK